MSVNEESYDLTILDLNNNSHTVHCYGYEHTIEYVKFVLAMKTSINKNMISLYLGNKQLEDYKTLGEYKIDKNSRLRMFFKIKTGWII